MANGDNQGQAIVNAVSPDQQMAQDAESSGAMQGSMDQIQAQRAEEGSTTAQTKTQQQAPKMGGQPLLYRYISELVKGQAGGRPISRGDASLNFMGEFLGNLANGLASAGHGPGANLRGAAGAIQAPYQRSLQDFQVQQQANQQAAQIQGEQARAGLEEAQAKNLANVVQTPYGPMSAALAAKIWPAEVAKQGRVEAATIIGQSRENAADTRAQAQQAITDKQIASKEGIAQKSLAEKQSEFKQTQGYKVWKEKLDKDTQLKVADLTQNKAPAAMLQTASFATGGLQMMADAKAAMARLEAKGVMGTVGKNKVEDWIFGKGLVDPTLDAETRKDIGIVRAATGYTSSAAMRAHTGRTSQEIYGDFKKRLGPDQDWNALNGAFDETTTLLTHYADAASNASIRQTRQGQATQGTGAPQRPPNVPDKAVWDGTTRRWRMP